LILETASRLLAEEGLERLTIVRLAETLGVTPAAIRWHVRRKEDLLEGLVEAASGSQPPHASPRKPWRKQVIDLLTWFRGELLAHRELLGESRCWGPLMIAFPHVDLACRAVLRNAGFDGKALRMASRTLYWHTFAFVTQETIASNLRRHRDVTALERTLELFRPEEISALIGSLERPDMENRDELFMYGVEALLDGVEKDLRSSRRPARSRS
jgi:AcrR family transcriptional regulator